MDDRIGNKIKEQDEVLFAYKFGLMEGQIIRFGKFKVLISYRSFGSDATIWKYPHSIIKHISPSIVNDTIETCASVLIDSLGTTFDCEECGTELSIFDDECSECGEPTSWSTDCQVKDIRENLNEIGYTEQ
jgi:hypothetical protein